MPVGANEAAAVDEAWYNFATAQAARGNLNEAFADLDRAVKNGLVSAAYLAADTELQLLHGDPRFEAAVAVARAATYAGTKWHRRSGDSGTGGDSGT